VVIRPNATSISQLWQIEQKRWSEKPCHYRACSTYRAESCILPKRVMRNSRNHKGFLALKCGFDSHALPPFTIEIIGCFCQLLVAKILGKSTRAAIKRLHDAVLPCLPCTVTIRARTVSIRTDGRNTSGRTKSSPACLKKSCYRSCPTVFPRQSESTYKSSTEPSQKTADYQW